MALSCEVTVRIIPHRPGLGWPAWYYARCACGWSGGYRPTFNEARIDALDHQLPGSADHIADAGRRVNEVLNTPWHPVEQG